MPIVVQGSGAYLELALANLLDNGLKFTPAGGTIQLGAMIATVEKADAASWVELWVQDTGPGITPADHPYIFERFYRGQQTHLSADETGCGLGLAIVQSIVNAHGGEVTVQSEMSMGSRFVIKLPLAA